MQNGRVLCGLAALVGLALGFMPATAPAQTFTKPVRIIVPFAPGGTCDILARLISPKLQDAIGQPVVVENKTGAGGNIGADFVAQADKDGHTLLLIDVSTLAISPNLLASMTYSPTKDLAPVGMILCALRARRAPECPGQDRGRTGGARQGQSGKVPFGNAGIGVANHISAVQLEKTWGVQFKHMPYRGGADAIKGIVSGESQVILNGATATASFVAQGQLNGLAVSGDRRVDSIKDLPTFKELNVTPTDVGSWQGLLTTAGTPAAGAGASQRRTQQDPGHARYRQAHPGSRRRGEGRSVCGVSQVDRDQYRGLCRHHQGSRHQGAVRQPCCTGSTSRSWRSGCS